MARSSMAVHQKLADGGAHCVQQPHRSKALEQQEEELREREASGKGTGSTVDGCNPGGGGVGSGSIAANVSGA